MLTTLWLPWKQIRLTIQDQLYHLRALTTQRDVQEALQELSLPLRALYRPRTVLEPSTVPSSDSPR